MHLSERNANTKFAKAAQLTQKGKWKAASDLYQQILQDKPNNASAWHLLGLTLMQQGKQDKALEAIEKAIALDPNQAEFHNHAGVIHFNLGNLEQGISCLQKSLALKPQSLDCRYNLALGLQKAGRVNEAKQEYQKIINQNPQYEAALKGLKTLRSHQKPNIAPNPQDLALKPESISFSLFDLFNDIPLIDIVNIGASQLDGEEPYQKLIDINKARLVGFEPNPEQYNKLKTQESEQCRFLPYAIADGKLHTLNICNAPGMSSLLEPDMSVLQHFPGFAEWGQIIEQKTIATKRLDDVEEITAIDYLKLDVQGSELSIIQNGLQSLSKTLVVHIEVQFVPFYKNQPLFGDLDRALNQVGFYLHRFTPIVSRVFKPMMINNNVYSGLSQVLWTDAIYVRKFTDFAQLNCRELLKIAAISHDLYGSYDLCSLALGHVDHQEQTNRQSLYLQKLSGKNSQPKVQIKKRKDNNLSFALDKKFKLKNAIFFLSTGRCGTQWLQKILSQTYADEAIVTHEPIGPQYQPKKFFRAYNKLEQLQSIPLVQRHLAWLHSLPENKIYIETGWPCFAAIPLLCNLLEGKIKIVHLVRNPVYTALSLCKHNFYRADIRNDDYIKLAQLDPFIPGILQRDYQNRWQTMTAYEKCLFQWTEINQYARELHQRFAKVPFLQIKMEDLFQDDSEAMESLIDFINLPFKNSLKESLALRIDDYQYQTNLDYDWQQIFNHSGTISLAKQLGYDF
ncbi:MAG: tetratricopeptide repeat protein [Cyanobacteria bacterium P01_F01_bin.143]